MPELTFIRHAETYYNKAGIFAGRIDCSATQKGLEEAKILFKEDEKNFDYIYCSPLKRTKQTLDVFIPNSKPIIDERIIEISIGEWEGKEKSSFDKDLIDLYRAGKYTPPGAETTAQVDERVCDFVESLFNKYKNNEKILIITHNGVMRSIKRNFGRDYENIMSKNLEKINITNDDFEYYKIHKDKKIIVYAHRGASAYAPENTKIAFEKAIELNANGIELDLQKTKDRKIVIFHDDTIDNKSNGSGKISDYTYQELLKLDFGSWFNQKYYGEHIMLFEDFAKEFLNKNLTFAIELKVLDIEKEVLEIINKYKVHNNIYITSFIYEALENVRKLDPNIKLSWVIKDRINKDSIEKLLRIKGSQICPKADLVCKEDIETANSNRLGVRLWGINNEAIMKKVYGLNIEGMTVDFPDKLIELLR